jgi:hypothetical protein
MAKAKKETTPVVTKETPVDGGIVINNLQLRLVAVDRSMKDIKDFKDALLQASRIYSPNRTELYDLYETVTLDPHLKGICNKRRSTLVNKKLKFVKKDVVDDDITMLSNKSTFREMRKELFDQKLFGLTGLEFIPGETFDFTCIPRKHIKPDVKMITQDQWGNTGIVYEGVWNLWIIGDVDDLGLYLECSPYALWKKGNMGDWAQYIEIFGQPVIITKYDAYDVKTKIELDEAMKKAGASLRLQIPNQANFEMLDGKQSNGDGALQDGFRKACNQEMSVLILGNTETTVSSDSSGYAQGKIHHMQQHEITDNDMIDELSLLNDEYFFSILKSYGYSPDGGEFVYDEELDLDRLSKETTIDAFLITIAKLPLDDDYFYERYNRPKPTNYEAMKKEQKDAEKAAQQNKFNIKNQFTEFEEVEGDDDAVKKEKRESRNILQRLLNFFG